MKKERLTKDQINAMIWKKWQSGVPMIRIAHATEKDPTTIFSYLRYHGGIAPRSCTRSSRSLSLAEREEISRELASGCSLRSIARLLGRSPSTICREINRNGGTRRYRATIADKAAWRRAKRPKPCALAKNPELKELVRSKLAEDWSPEQISGWLKLTYPTRENMHVSHETIYKSLYIQARGLFRKQMRKHLRTKRKFRRAKNHQMASGGRRIDGIPISERPALIEDRAVPGHWEGDLIVGSKNSFIATVVERQTRFTVLVKVKGKDTKSVVSALTRQMEKLPDLLKQSLTWDQGPELASHRKFFMATSMDVYFCDPASPWQRGTNENTNGLLRQYFPKGECMSGYSQKALNKVAAKLNTRPRKTLGFKTPAEKISMVLQ